MLLNLCLDDIGVQIVDICLATRTHNGGLISLQELRNLLCQRRKSTRDAVSEDDCLRAISKLKVLIHCFFAASNSIKCDCCYAEVQYPCLLSLHLGVWQICVWIKLFIVYEKMYIVTVTAEIMQGINILQVLGNGFEVISVGKKKLVRSVPTELNKDHNAILELAQVHPFVCSSSWFAS